MIEVRHLRLLVALAEHGTLTRAAAALALSQSALSRQLLELEGDLGRPLFDRRHRRLIPTETGTELTGLARRTLGELEAAARRVRASEAEPRPLAIATECYTLYRWLPSVLRDLERAHPGQRITINVDATREPADALLRGAIDVALLSDPRRDRRLLAEPAFADEMVLVMAPGHRLEGRRFVTAADLAGETLITYAAPFDGTFLGRRLFRPAGLRPARVHPVPLTEAIVELCAAGIGVASMARWAAAPYVAEGHLALARLTRAGLRRAWQVAHRRGAPPATALLASLIRQAVRPERARAAQTS